MSKKRKHNISLVKVQGFKSFKEECSVNIKPLTLLAGANSSGKSSIFQPLLMMKQTLNEAYDPGALQLKGANVKFTSSKQVFTKNSNSNEFSVEIEDKNGGNVKLVYEIKQGSKGFEINSMRVYEPNGLNALITLDPVPEVYDEIIQGLPDFVKKLNEDLPVKPNIIRKRCFLEFELCHRDSGKQVMGSTFVGPIETQISEMIHLPGLRGNPERNYPLTYVDFENINFSGTFEKYVASIIATWKDTKNRKKLNKLNKYLSRLGLASNIDTKYINDTEIELFVSRFNNSPKDDMVNIADVGLGVSQTLPILVALLVAKKNQIVYVEQPEIHLHPKAQYELANIFAEALNDGITLVMETHSSVLLRGIQTIVAEGTIDAENVALHWFLRDESGYSYAQSAELDESGAFGDWPEDFDDVTLTAESNYLEAVEKRFFSS